MSWRLENKFLSSRVLWPLPCLDSGQCCARCPVPKHTMQKILLPNLENDPIGLWCFRTHLWCHLRTSKKTWDSSIDSPSLVDQPKKNISKFRSSGISSIYHQFWGRLPIVLNVRGLPGKTSWLDMITVAMDVPMVSGSDQNLVNPDLPAICGQLSMVDHRSLTGRSWHRNIELCRPVGHGSSIGKSNLECGAIANNRAYYKTNARWIE